MKISEADIDAIDARSEHFEQDEGGFIFRRYTEKRELLEADYQTLLEAAYLGVRARLASTEGDTNR